MSGEGDPAVDAAWAYERLHVDALFRQWAEPVLDSASVQTGLSVLDVACGTGALARESRGRVGSSGSVTGLDAAPGMLAVAEQLAPGVRWIEGDACELPFDDDEFDVVMCQFGLMFFADPVQAIREMLRCTKPAGNVTVAVWDALERSAAYPTSVELLDRRAGSDAANALRAPFVMGDPDDLRALFESAGASAVSINTLTGTARFPSVRTMVEADLRGWLPVMGVVLADELIESILTEAEHALKNYVSETGEMIFDAPAHIVTAQG
ncbi:MAG: methyltransferase domain-containing protein [Ilumatobacter sp.]|uniref:methyltransferase domain-containing protein n=1 Tax=Ilumatobacter sp. TaxID=1967498 RepID=UPI003C740DF7